MPTMAPSKPWQIRVSDPLANAVDAFCAKNDVERSELIRQAVAEKIGRVDLLETMPKEGRPKSAPKKPPRRKKS